MRSDAEHDARSASTSKAAPFSPLRALLRFPGSFRLLAAGVLAAVAGTLLLAAPAFAASEYAKVASFGSGALPASPFGLALDQASGEVLVADGGTVQRFSPASRPDPSAGYSLTSPLPGPFGFAFGVGVDNSGGLSQGEVYVADAGNQVADKFIGPGKLEEGEPGEPPQFGPGASPLALLEPGDVAVDPSNGDIYISDSPNNTIDVYEPSGVFQSQFSTGPEPIGLAFNSAGSDLYVVAGEKVEEFDASGSPVEQTAGPNAGTNVLDSGHRASSVAVDPATNDVYVGDQESVAAYDSTGAPLSPPGFQTGIGFSFGIAVDDTTHAVYVSDANKNEVDVFQLITLPDVTTGVPSNVTETNAMLNGTVNPDGVNVTSCEFEYGLESPSEHIEPCSDLPGSGTEPVHVHVNLEGLEPGGTYHYRLDAGNLDGTSPPGADETFTTSSKPIVKGEFFSEVSSTSATLSAQINAEGLATTYYFEYGTSTSYGSATPQTSLGAAQNAVGVSAELNGLQPNTVYHFRVIATSELGAIHGADATFTTFAVSTAGLPDNRAYEMVTPVANQNANVYAPSIYLGNFSEEEGVLTEHPFQASADGSAVAYTGAPTLGGNGNAGVSGGNQYLAARSAQGAWTQRNIQPLGYREPEYRAFSSDLSVGFIYSNEALTEDAPAGDVLYSRDSADGSYRALAAGDGYAGESANGSHVLLGSAGDSDHPGTPTSGSLYDSVEGRLVPVNVLPGEQGALAPNATFGAPPTTSEEFPDLSHVISTDGSRIFWTDLSTEDLYVRENDERTVAVSVGPARYWTASPDGRYVFYTEAGALLRFDAQSETREEIAPSSAVVEGVIGTNETGEDGSYVYFVADGALTGANAEGESPTAGHPNLYLFHAGTTMFIATLAPADGGGIPPFISLQGGGDWQPGLGNRTAGVAADGHGVVFMSTQSLTGYPNVGSVEGRAIPVSEVYDYDAQAERLSCVSCNPSGEPLSTTNFTIGHEATAFVPISHSATYLPRWISADGSRVFFNSNEPLVPRDSNGKQDVYEWERDGAGSCHGTRGCIYLLSEATSTSASWLLDAGESGDDVFIITRARLAPQDRNDNFDVYDVRVGGMQPLSPPACEGTGCQGVPPAPPIFATPASGTFEGTGNFPPRFESRKCKKGFVKRHGRCAREKAKKSTRGGR